jgi:DNA polymerase V
MYALIDANNFYVSCERVFRPGLKGRPVIVLSNNDGCAISRSNEAKALGVKMGAPWFKMRELAEREGIVALSANYVLYGDMSNRMMSLAAGLGPQQEIYSIDESFVTLQGVRGDLVARGYAVRRRIEQWTGLPCGVGMGTTKTLAKLANHVAKSAERKPGSYPAEFAQVCNLAALPASDLDAVLAVTEVGDIWGIGRRIGAQLQEAGVRTALDLTRLDAAAVRARWSVVLERTVRELQGTRCISLDDAPASKKQIACTRSFGRAITALPDLLEAVSSFATRAAEKLRSQESLAGQLLVFVHTSPFAPGPQYSRSVTLPLRRPSCDTNELARTAMQGMRAIYKDGYRMAKAGVMLMDLQDASVQQQELSLACGPGDEVVRDRSKLMTALDSVNARYGRGTLQVAGSGIEGKRQWR